MSTVEQKFGLLIEHGEVVAIGPIETVSYGPEPTDFYVLSVNAKSDIEVHPGSTSIGFIPIPIPSLN